MSLARILIIEDNPADVLILRHALNQQGEKFELEILKNGEEALRFVQEHRDGIRQPEPCVILLDLHLPLHDGRTVLQAIRQAPVLAHIHVVVLTGSDLSQEEVEMMATGTLYRKKPMNLEGFLALGCEVLALCKGVAAQV